MNSSQFTHLTNRVFTYVEDIQKDPLCSSEYKQASLRGMTEVLNVIYQSQEFYGMQDAIYSEVNQMLKNLSLLAEKHPEFQHVAKVAVSRIEQNVVLETNLKYIDNDGLQQESFKGTLTDIYLKTKELEEAGCSDICIGYEANVIGRYAYGNYYNPMGYDDCVVVQISPELALDTGANISEHQRDYKVTCEVYVDKNQQIEEIKSLKIENPQDESIYKYISFPKELKEIIRPLAEEWLEQNPPQYPTIAGQLLSPENPIVIGSSYNRNDFVGTPTGMVCKVDLYSEVCTVMTVEEAEQIIEAKSPNYFKESMERIKSAVEEKQEKDLTLD